MTRKRFLTKLNEQMNSLNWLSSFLNRAPVSQRRVAFAKSARGFVQRASGKLFTGRQASSCRGAAKGLHSIASLIQFGDLKSSPIRAITQASTGSVCWHSNIQQRAKSKSTTDSWPPYIAPEARWYMRRPIRTGGVSSSRALWPPLD